MNSVLELKLEVRIRAEVLRICFSLSSTKIHVTMMTTECAFVINQVCVCVIVFSVQIGNICDC